MTNPVILDLYLVLGLVYFCLGIYGALTRKNAIGILISIEIMFNAANLNLVAFSRFNKNFEGQLFALFVIAVVAAETVVALAIIFAIYKSKKTLLTDKMNLMKW